MAQAESLEPVHVSHAAWIHRLGALLVRMATSQPTSDPTTQDLAMGPPAKKEVQAAAAKDQGSETKTKIVEDEDYDDDFEIIEQQPSSSDQRSGPVVVEARKESTVVAMETKSDAGQGEESVEAQRAREKARARQNRENASKDVRALALANLVRFAALGHAPSDFDGIIETTLLQVSHLTLKHDSFSFVRSHSLTHSLSLTHSILNVYFF